MLTEIVCMHGHKTAATVLQRWQQLRLFTTPICDAEFDLMRLEMVEAAPLFPSLHHAVTYICATRRQMVGI